MNAKVALDEQERLEQFDRPKPASPLREVLSEAAILARLREMAEYFYDPNTHERASKYVPDRLIRIADAGTGECNWTVGPLDGVPAPMAMYIFRQAKTLQASCNLARSQSSDSPAP